VRGCVTTLRPVWYMDVSVEHEMQTMMGALEWIVDLHAACAEGPSGGKVTPVALLVYADPEDSSY
jgi:hypothetical protein